MSLEVRFDFFVKHNMVNTKSQHHQPCFLSPKVSGKMLLKEDRSPREVGFGVTQENGGGGWHYGAFGEIIPRDILGTRTTGYLRNLLEISMKCAIKKPPLFLLFFSLSCDLSPQSWNQCHLETPYGTLFPRSWTQISQTKISANI